MKTLVIACTLLLLLLFSPGRLPAQRSDIVWMKGGGHFGGITATALSPDGSRFASIDLSGRALVRERDSGETLGWINTGRSGSQSIHFLRDGEELLLAYADEVVIWTIGSGSLRRFPTSSASLVGAYPRAGGAQLVMIGEDGIGRLYDIATGDSVGRFDLGLEGILATRILSDGDALAFVGEDRVLRGWNLVDGGYLHCAVPLQGGPEDLLAATSSSTLALVRQSDSSVAIHDVATGTLVDTISIVGLVGDRFYMGFLRLPIVAGAAFSPEGDTLFLHSSIDGRIRSFDLRTGATLHDFDDRFAYAAMPVIDLEGLGITSSLTLSRDGGDLWVVSHKRLDIYMARFALSSDTGASPSHRLDLTPNPEAVGDLAIAHDGRSALTIAGPTLMSWSLPEGIHPPVRRLAATRLAYYAIGPDAQSVLSYESEYLENPGNPPGRDEYWASFGSQIITLPVPFYVEPGRLAISPGSRYALIGDRIYSSGTFATLPIPGFTAATFSSDTIRLALRREESIVLWNCLDQNLERTFEPGGTIASMAFSRDGSRLACGLQSGGMIVFDVGSGGEIARMSGHAGAIRSLAFSRDDLFLVSSGADSTIRTWDVATALELYTYREYPGITTALDATADGRYILAGTDRGAVILYDARWTIASVPVGPAIDFVCSVYPNPASGERLEVSIRGHAGDLTIELFDMAGSVVARHHGDGVGDRPVELRVAHLPAGLYICRVGAGTSSTSRVVVIAR